MAGDWIKMRTDLYRDPKVCVMAEFLMAEDGELGKYVNQHCRRNMTVTRNVTRCAVVGGLLSVWGVIRHRGKRFGDDLRCAGVTVAVIDDIADVPGFGEAMEQVGWVVQSDEGIVFPRFFAEYNAEPTDRPKSKAAERQARYRQRNAASQSVTRTVTDSVTESVTCDVTRNVTRDVTVTPREEKRREENGIASAIPIGGAEGETSEKPARKRKTFEAPTVEQVAAYVTEIGGQVDPGDFVDYYAARGWVMTNGRQMRDWQATVRTWERKRRDGIGTHQVAVHAAAGNGKRSGFATHEYDREDANNAALAAFLLEEGVLPGDARAHHAQKNIQFHSPAAKGLVLRSEAIPGPDDQSVGRGACNVGDAISGACRPIPAVPAEDATGVLPFGGE